MDARQQQQRELMEMQQQLLMFKKVSKLAKRCYARTITKAGNALSDSEKKSLGFCVNRYFDTQLFLTERLTAKARKMQENAGMEAK